MPTVALEKIDLPDFVRASLTFYLYSPSLDLPITASIEFAKHVTSEYGYALALDELVRLFNETQGVTDFRPMTEAEVDRYLDAVLEGDAEIGDVADLALEDEDFDGELQ